MNMTDLSYWTRSLLIEQPVQGLTATTQFSFLIVVRLDVRQSSQELSILSSSQEKSLWLSVGAIMDKINPRSSDSV